MTSSFPNAAFVPGFGFARARDKAFQAIRHLWSVRQSQGLTQQDVAACLGKDPAWVSRKLSGPTNWTLRTFGDLADALDGEVEIHIVDLKSGHNQGNSNAYHAYDNPVVRITSNPVPISSQKINRLQASGSNSNVEVQFS